MKIIRIASGQDYLLLPELVWDGISEGPVKDQAVQVSGGLISKILPVTELCDSTEGHPKILDLRGITLMPGLVDCHVHFSMNSENLFQAIDDWDNRPDVMENQVRKAAADYLLNGVIAVRDGGDKKGISLNVRDSIKRGDYPGPLVTATGKAIYRRGLYGEFLGPGIKSPKEAINQVRLFKEEGVDQIKIVLSGLVSFKDFGIVGPPQFTFEELEPVVYEAHSLGLRVMAHASSAKAVEIAAKAGVDSVEHGYFVETAQLELMAKNKTAWVPTLAPLGNLVAGKHLPYRGADLEVIRKTLEIQISRLKEAWELKVQVGVGTDAGANLVLHGYSYHDELSYYSLAGLSNRTILQSATSVSARIINCDTMLGTISPGKKPFLIGLTGNPFISLQSLVSPALVIIPDTQCL